MTTPPVQKRLPLTLTQTPKPGDPVFVTLERAASVSVIHAVLKKSGRWDGVAVQGLHFMVAHPDRELAEFRAGLPDRPQFKLVVRDPLARFDSARKLISVSRKRPELAEWDAFLTYAESRYGRVVDPHLRTASELHDLLTIFGPVEVLRIEDCETWAPEYGLEIGRHNADKYDSAETAGMNAAQLARFKKLHGLDYFVGQYLFPHPLQA